ncbi:MAG TPA: hypothetical protein VF600_07775 [Abditibacteriaceae bacterium]|jgi:hypothetical protein
MKWRWLRYGLVATPILVLVVLLVMAVWRATHAFSPQPVRDFKTLAKWTELKFPAGAKVIDGEVRAAGTLVVVVKAELPYSQVYSFITQPALKNAKLSRGKLNDEYGVSRSMKQYKNLSVGNPRNFVSLSRPYNSGLGLLWMLINLDDPQTAVLYLYYSD